jgi:hypothetical protein
MSAESLSLTFQSVTALALLLVLVLVWRAEQRIDVFRQRMFAIRDELFDFASEGGVDFQHPAYQLLRNSMNGFIRYAHRLTFFQLLTTIARWKITEQVHPLTWHSKWTEALDSLPVSSEVKLRKLHGCAMDTVARHLVGGSFTLSIFVFLTGIHLLIQGAWTSIRMIVRDASESVVTKVFDQRLIEEEAVRC